MEIPSQPTPSSSSLHDPLAGALQLRRYGDGVQGDGQRRRQHGENAPIRLGQPTLALAQTDNQGANRLLAVSQLLGDHDGRSGTLDAYDRPSASMLRYGSFNPSRMEAATASSPLVAPLSSAPSRKTIRLGLARSPYMARSTARCSRGSSGAASSTNSTVVSADRPSHPVTNRSRTVTNTAYPASTTSDSSSQLRAREATSRMSSRR